MNHTKEKWEYREYPDGSDCFITAAKENGMAYGPDIMGDDYTGYGDIERKKADAKRIVACVNACTGITNEALEAGYIQECVDWAKVGKVHNEPKFRGIKVFEEDV